MIPAWLELTVLAVGGYGSGIGADRMVTGWVRQATTGAETPWLLEQGTVLWRGRQRYHDLLPLLGAIGGVILGVLNRADGIHLVTGGVLGWSLMVLAFIDLETQWLPDRLTQPLLWGGLILGATGWGVGLSDSVWGAVGGYGVMALVHGLFYALTRRTGLGRGDWKLMAVLGAWLGWPALPAVLIIASSLGVLAALGASRRSRQPLRSLMLPFGPFLALGGYGVMLWQMTLGGGL